MVGVGNDLQNGAFITLNGKQWKESFDDLVQAAQKANSIDITKRRNDYLAEFAVSNSVDLNWSLKNMGTNALLTEEADLSNMTQTEDVHLNNFIQTMHFNISEKGVSAEKIDEKTTENSTLDNGTDVKVNRPFIFAVIDNESNIPLYLGIMENL